MKRSLITTAFIMSSMLCAQEYVLEPVGIQEDVSENENVQIDAQDIKQRQAQTTKEIFATEPSISVGGGGSTHAQRLYLRGVEQSNLNVTIDGADQGRATHPGQGNMLRIDPTILKQVEVDTSPSADAGPGALGGAIRFTTVDAQDLLESDENMGAKIRLGYGTVDEAKTLGATVYAQLLENIGFVANFNSIKTEDYRMGNGEKNFNSYEETENYFLKLSMLNLEGHNFRIMADQNEQSGQRTWNANSEIGYILDEFDPALANMSRKRQSLGFEHTYISNNPFLNTRLKLNQSKLEFERTAMETQVTQAPMSDLYLENLVRNANFRNTAQFDFLGSSNQLVIGVDYKEEESTLAGQPTAIEANNLGFYIQNRAQIQDLSLSFGLRQDRFNADQGVMRLKGDELSPNLSASYEMLDGFSIYASYAEAVRGSGNLPAMYQLLLVNNPEATYNGKKINENPDPFKPESSVKTEYGMNYQTKALFSAEDKIKFKLTLFNTEMENLIGEGPGGGQTVFNLPTLISKGLEARVNYKLNSKLETTLAFTDTQVEDKDGNVYISARFNRHAANAGQRLVWNNKWFPTSSLFLGYTLRASMDVNDVPDGEEPRKGYVIHDIQATWNPKFLQSAEISLIANNLFDKAYREATTLGNTDEQRVYEPGRNIRLITTYTF